MNNPFWVLDKRLVAKRRYENAMVYNEVVLSVLNQLKEVVYPDKAMLVRCEQGIEDFVQKDESGVRWSIGHIETTPFGSRWIAEVQVTSTHKDRKHNYDMSGFDCKLAQGEKVTNCPIYPEMDTMKYGLVEALKELYP